MSENVNQRVVVLNGYHPMLSINPDLTCANTGPVTITFPTVVGATGYRIYTAADLRRLEEMEARAHKLRLAFNKRKKQARARTGRR